MCVRVSLCTTVLHDIVQNSSNNFPSYPPDNHHNSAEVYWRAGGAKNISTQDVQKTNINTK